MVTSHADRTAPVLRGKWMLENLLGTPPPPPPANVPPLEARRRAAPAHDARADGEHRANPACAGCHQVMDPLGFALENFDAVGAWRTREAGAAARRLRARWPTARRWTASVALRACAAARVRMSSCRR